MALTTPLQQIRRQFPDSTIVFNKERVAAFNDAVIAIAITLLVLDIHPSVENLHTSADVWKEVYRLLPNIISFTISFWLISRFWITNQVFFQSVKKLDMRMLQYNLWFLFFIALLPFPTMLLASVHLTEAKVIIYALFMGVASIVQSMMWRQLLEPDKRSEGTTEFAVKFRVLQYRLSASIFFGSIALSFVNVWAAIILWLFFGFNRLFTEVSTESFDVMEKWFQGREKKK